MAAYVVLDINVTHSETFAKYRELAPPAIAAYGGKYLARGGAAEGAWPAAPSETRGVVQGL